MSWKVQTFQVVWFPENVSDLSAEVLFEVLAGAAPDSSISNRAPTPQAPFFSQASGVSNGLSNSVRVAPGRVDWFISAPKKESESPYANLMEIDAGIDLIRQSIDRLNVGQIGGATRLSLVTSIRHPVSSAAEANMIFTEMCDLSIKGEELRDLTFQLNCRRTINEDVSINRIGKFGTEIASQVLVQMNADIREFTQVSPANEEYHSASVTFDFNTVPTGKKFPDDKHSEIFEEIFKDTAKASANPRIKFFDQA